MSDKDKLITMIETDPELYSIINSKEHIFVLGLFIKEPRTFEEILRKTDFKKVSILYNILDNLLAKKYIRKLNINKNEVYYITAEGKSFLTLVESAKKDFNLL